MLISELYTGDFFKTGRYAPEFDTYAIQKFETAYPILQAQQLVPVGQSLGDGKAGKVFEIINDAGGFSPSRGYYDDVDPNVVPSETKTVFMGINSEKVVASKAQVRLHGTEEKDKQLKAALARLHHTFAFKLFNADTTKVDATSKAGNNYEYDGYVKYFKDNPDQANMNLFSVGDIVNDVNLRLKANHFLRDVNSRINVDGFEGDMIYTSKAGRVLLTALESDKMGYAGPYKFSRRVNTWEGIPIVEVPDNIIPEEWKAIGEFVLFVNQDEEAGCRIMVPNNGGLIETYSDVDKGYTVETPMDMVYAPVLVNGKAASLCFISMGKLSATDPTDGGNGSIEVSGITTDKSYVSLDSQNSVTAFAYYTVNPSDATDKSVTIASLNTNVANAYEGTQPGEVYIEYVGEGSTQVEIRSNSNNAIVATITVDCTDTGSGGAVNDVQILDNAMPAGDISVNEQETYALTYNTDPAGEPVTVSTGDGNIATAWIDSMDDTIYVDGVSVGTTTLTLSADNDPAVSQTINVTVTELLP